MGFPLIRALFGSEGLLYASAFVTVFNILLWTLGYGMVSGKTQMKEVLRSIFTCPCILAVIVGLILYLGRIPVPELLAGPIGTIGADHRCDDRFKRSRTSAQKSQSLSHPRPAPLLRARCDTRRLCSARTARDGSYDRSSPGSLPLRGDHNPVCHSVSPRRGAWCGSSRLLHTCKHPDTPGLCFCFDGSFIRYNVYFFRRNGYGIK